MNPEEHLAIRVRARYRLAFPIDAKALAGKFADIIEENLPENVDAIVLHRSASMSRPQILLDPDRPPSRKLFTVAHEIGHLIIPWHVGTIACHIDRHLSFSNRLYAATEAEANRFASALLMPSDWVKMVVSTTSSNFDQIYDEFQKIGVSKIAATLRLVQFLPAGFIFAICDEYGSVDFAGSSPDTRAGAPERHQVLDSSAFDRDASFRWSKKSIFWWRFSGYAAPSFNPNDTDAKTLLREIVSDADPGRQDKIYKQIMSITGAANGTKQFKGEGELYNLFVQRFVGRTDIDQAVQVHPRLKEYLWKRAHELIANSHKN
jgi:hypothetical protein